MMSLDKVVEIDKKFLAAKFFFDKIGWELVGTKDISNEEIYLVKKKKKQKILDFTSYNS